MKNTTKCLVVDSLGVLMTRRDISSLTVKGLMVHRGKLEFGPYNFSFINLGKTVQGILINWKR